MRSQLSQLGRVGNLVPWIDGEILVGAELGGVDEQGGASPRGKFPRAVYQRQVPLVEGPHGRYQADGIAGLTPSADTGAEVRYRPNDIDAGLMGTTRESSLSDHSTFFVGALTPKH